VVALAIAGAALGGRVVPRIASLEARPAALAWLGAGTMAGAWTADALLLPRLYPAFHAAMLVAVLVGGAVAGIGLGAAWREPRWLGRTIMAATAAGIVLCATACPGSARALEHLANLRIILVAHAPVLGPAVEMTSALRHPEEAVPVVTLAPPGEIARSLDWTGHDIVMLTVDALRADHVSSYGYARPTTPAIDALARQGAVFSAAFCPTPHTSYSISSMMTGKYLRPLLALGLGEDSETWAQDLRRYGWRTAAFYPPAVFFIDEDRFPRFEQSHLGFEYAKVEFADPALREQQVAAYLDGAPAPTPLFLWVHFFEPHEPYVMHPEHPFFGGPSADVDAYDSEVAEADEGIGRIVRLVGARRPGAVVIVTADHGEEFGEHGGRYHGTTVYDEQVRVPLVVAGPGVVPGARIDAAVQTIDLLPTALSALGIPRPARLRGRDLGPLLAGKASATEPGFAFAETDGEALVAEGTKRVVCERRAAACVLYDLSGDPLERRDEAAVQPGPYREMLGELRATERDHGRLEGGGGPVWPEAIRLGMQGESSAAGDVAALLDDADLAVRRKAGEVTFDLHAAAAAPQLRRELGRDEDDEVRRWVALALARIPGETPPVAVEAMLKDPARDWRRRAALALAERGDPRACDEIAAWWTAVLPPPGQGSAEGEPPRLTIDLAAAEALLGATARARCRASVPALVQALVDVRARPYVADALGALGDERARAPLQTLLAGEPYVTTRPHEARALVALGARAWAAPAGPPPGEARPVLQRSGTEALRLVVLVSEPQAKLEGTLGGDALPATGGPGEGVRYLAIPAGSAGAKLAPTLRASKGGIEALWLLPSGPLD
jgi:hypothetical protein